MEFTSTSRWCGVGENKESLVCSQGSAQMLTFATPSPTPPLLPWGCNHTSISNIVTSQIQIDFTTRKLRTENKLCKVKAHTTFKSPTAPPPFSPFLVLPEVSPPSCPLPAGPFKHLQTCVCGAHQHIPQPKAPRGYHQ